MSSRRFLFTAGRTRAGATLALYLQPRCVLRGRTEQSQDSKERSHLPLMIQFQQEMNHVVCRETLYDCSSAPFRTVFRRLHSAVEAGSYHELICNRSTHNMTTCSHSPTVS